MTIAKFYDFPQFGDARGSIVVIDKNIRVPFGIKRVYYIFGTIVGASRGFHAHKKTHQIAVCVTGSVNFVLDDGFSREKIQLNSPSRGIDLPPGLWHEMHEFSPDCVLLVLASHYYDDNDYIRSYSSFLSEVSELRGMKN